jgi:hypothetical protein
MAKFQGYFSGWDKCVACGMRLIKVGNSLRHRRGWVKIHNLIVAKKHRKGSE